MENFVKILKSQTSMLRVICIHFHKSLEKVYESFLYNSKKKRNKKRDNNNIWLCPRARRNEKTL